MRPEVVERVMATIDEERLAELRERHAGDYAAKYLDVEMWIARNWRRIQWCGLDRGYRRRVLDLGCGCGYFLYLCKLLGHEVIGVDCSPWGGLFHEMTSMLGVPVVQHEIKAFELLPDLGRFDVVTAHMICFNGHRATLWGPEEWDVLLGQFPGATFHLELNREPDGTVMTRELEQYFSERGATIAGHRVLIDRP